MKVNDVLYTIDPNEIGTTIVGRFGKGDYSFEGIEGYCFAQDLGRGTTVALHRFYNSVTHDHVYTTDVNEFGNGDGYDYEGITCYVLAD